MFGVWDLSFSAGRLALRTGLVLAQMALYLSVDLSIYLSIHEPLSIFLANQMDMHPV